MNKGKAVFIFAIVAFFGMAGYLISQNNKGAGGMRLPEQGAPAGDAGNVPGGARDALVETRPVLPASNFEGRAARAYQIAAEIPGIVDKLYCYCMCKENPNFKHKTLLTCYTDNHAAECGICMHEAEVAQEMTKAGKSVADIRAAIDEYYKNRN